MSRFTVGRRVRVITREFDSGNDDDQYGRIGRITSPTHSGGWMDVAYEEKYYTGAGGRGNSYKAEHLELLDLTKLEKALK